MRKITDKDLDNKFRQAFDAMEVTPQEGLFAKIDKDLHQKKNRRMPVFVAAASIAVIVAIGFVWKTQSPTEVIGPKITTNFSQKIEKVENISLTKIAQSGTNLVAKTNKEKSIEKSGKKSIGDINHLPNPKHYNENVVVIKKQEPKIFMGKDNTIQQNIQGDKKANEHMALVQTKEVQLPTTIIETNKQPVLDAIAVLPKADDNDVLGASIEDMDVRPQSRRSKFVSGLLKNLKRKVSDITSEVVSSNSDSTTVNLGFVAITKYKN